MNPYEVEAKKLYDTFTNAAESYRCGKECAIIHIQELIKFGNEMNIREPMMKYNKILEELKKL